MEATGISYIDARKVSYTDNIKFLKFQAFAEQLTKETQDLKVKIETHKRENRRLTSLIEQQKDDAARLTVRLSGTEKQRDDALEALVLQQEIAEELERERKRNRKELSALQHTNDTIIRQRNESQRVVLHLRSLIDGQTHHMEHIVRSLNKAPELSDYIEEGYEDVPEDAEEHDSVSSEAGRRVPSIREEPESRSFSRSSTHDGDKLDNEKVTPEMESRFFTSLDPTRSGSRLSIADVADRHLRDKTDAIAYIIRNISDQCAAAVEGLHLAHNAEAEDAQHLEPELPRAKLSHKHTNSDGDVSMHTDVSQLGADDNGEELDSGHGGSTGFLTPHEDMGGRQSRTSSLPPTPDLIGGRSSTSMSGYSNSTAPTQGRDSHQWQMQHDSAKGVKVLDSDEQSPEDDRSDIGQQESDIPVGGEKKRGSGIRPITASLVAA